MEILKVEAKRALRKPGTRQALDLVEFRKVYRRGFNLNRSLYEFHHRFCLVFQT